MRVADGRIQAIGPSITAPDASPVIDAGGRTLMPGLIDCHIHALASALSVQLVELQGEACRAAHGLRMGAHCTKIMGSGGVVSPTAPCWMTRYREDEIRAIVQECEARRTCATARCHPASAIRRCIEFGVTRIDPLAQDGQCLSLIARAGAIIRNRL